ncbi:MAG: sigma 54-interacting transcriptional regulator [Sphingopyxis sp.]|nr:sigma 54-interacting transcriptional regulator [Sphingopyxis sp.]
MAKPQTILVVEDDPAIALIISEALRAEAQHIAVVTTLAARDASLLATVPDLLITDVVLPDGDGLETLPAQLVEAGVPVIVLSAQNTLDTAVRAADKGSYDYLPKPFDLGELIASVRSALSRHRAAPAEAGQSVAELPSHGLIGRAPAMQAVYRTIARLASNDLAVLILGESGTGKELAARAIHDTGLRRNGPFIAINMAAIPRDLIEAELFGHEKGAFTGATDRKVGRFEQAAGGTLFLDEIGDMPVDAQTRLLRVLQSNEYSRVGGRDLLRANVRVVAATHRDVGQLVQSGQFREDLYYRLNVIPIELPPLRERRSDIAALVDHFVREGSASGLPSRRFTLDAIEQLEHHGWPGNVRELANVVQRLTLLARDATVTGIDVGQILGRWTDASSDDLSLDTQLAELVAQWTRAKLGAASPAEALQAELHAITDGAVITAVLHHCRGNQLAAARILGINRNTLRKRISDLRLAARDPTG